MLQSSDTYLFSALSQYGYSLLEPEQMADPNELLARLAESRDARLLEGFPVVLANALRKHGEKLDLALSEKLLKNETDVKRFRKLTALSSYLFGVYGLESLTFSNRKVDPGLLAELRDSVERNAPLSLEPGALDLQRVKKTFQNYFVHAEQLLAQEDRAKLREDLRQAFYLSLFFAPKQKDLLLKKLRGEPLGKTDREYFSRVVKKKLLALADPDLHRLAQKALQ